MKRQFDYSTAVMLAAMAFLLLVSMTFQIVGCCYTHKASVYAEQANALNEQANRDNQEAIRIYKSLHNKH